MTSFLNQILFFAIPSGTEMTREEKIRRSVFSLGFFMCAGAVMWILFLLYLGLDLLSLIPGLYILLTAINLFLIFDWAPEKARFVQIFISLIFPFGMQAIMGGYYASGVVMLWSSVSLRTKTVASNSFVRSSIFASKPILWSFKSSSAFRSCSMNAESRSIRFKET